MEHSEGNQHSHDISAPSGCADRECIQTYDPVGACNGTCSCRYLQAQIKWPNDVVVGGKKICGILTEMSSEGMDIKYAVVGIGINVSMMEFPEELADKATSIKLENGTGCDRSKLVASVANHFEELYDAFVKCQDLQFMLDEYNSILVNKDEQVYVIEGYNRTEYTALGLAPNGGLRVKDKDGQESIIISGEVSVRGIYGYV